ncbi:MAG: macro domain-containing protein [Thermoleophilia bacterium]
MATAPPESCSFPAAPADLPTKLLTGLTLAILAALVLGGVVQVGVSAGEGESLGILRGLGYGFLAVLAGVFTLSRVPRNYRLERDGDYGTVLVIERRWSAAVRLALGRYQEVLDARRVIFPWVPLLSGTRVFGLRGARLEESLAGFWSFGRDGRRALIFSGPGRPRTLVSPDDPQALLAALARFEGAPRRSTLGEKVDSVDTVRVGESVIVLKRGDITEETVDGIVNAANSSLAGGGGVDGAIHRAGGSAILEECRTIVEVRGSLPAGEAVATTAGRLGDHGVLRVIHTVGPVWRGGGEGEEGTLRRAYASSLAVAVEEGLRTVAFPSISTGAYGYPVEQAAATALATVVRFLAENPGSLAEVRFVLFDETAFAAYRSALRFTTQS